jgi:hypothetical protein
VFSVQRKGGEDRDKAVRRRRHTFVSHSGKKLKAKEKRREEKRREEKRRRKIRNEGWEESKNKKKIIKG